MVVVDVVHVADVADEVAELCAVCGVAFQVIYYRLSQIRDKGSSVLICATVGDLDSRLLTKVWEESFKGEKVKVKVTRDKRIVTPGGIRKKKQYTYTYTGMEFPQGPGARSRPLLGIAKLWEAVGGT